HIAGGFLAPKTVEALFTSQRTTSGKVTNYGLGWSSGTDSAGRRWVGHTGGSVGARAVLLVYPDQRVVVAALANLGTAPMSPEFAERLAAPFIPGAWPPSALFAAPAHAEPLEVHTEPRSIRRTRSRGERGVACRAGLRSGRLRTFLARIHVHNEWGFFR